MIAKETNWQAKVDGSLYLTTGPEELQSFQESIIYLAFFILFFILFFVLLPVLNLTGGILALFHVIFMTIHMDISTDPSHSTCICEITGVKADLRAFAYDLQQPPTA